MPCPPSVPRASGSCGLQSSWACKSLICRALSAVEDAQPHQVMAPSHAPVASPMAQMDGTFVCEYWSTLIAQLFSSSATPTSCAWEQEYCSRLEASEIHLMQFLRLAYLLVTPLAACADCGPLQTSSPRPRVLGLRPVAIMILPAVVIGTKERGKDAVAKYTELAGPPASTRAKTPLHNP